MFLQHFKRKKYRLALCFDKKEMEKMASGIGSVVEHLPHHPKVGGSCKVVKLSGWHW